MTIPYLLLESTLYYNVDKLKYPLQKKTQNKYLPL